MTIKNLNKLIKDNYSNIQQNVPIKKLRRMRIAIDTSIIINKYRHVRELFDNILNKSDLINEGVNEELLTGAVISRLKDLIIKFMNHEIFPVFVFDGKPHKLKDQHEGMDRKEKKRKAKEELDAYMEEIRALDPLKQEAYLSQVKKLYKNAYSPSRDFYKKIKKFIQSCKLPWYQAKGESDEVLGYLSVNGKVDLVYSNDSDMYAHKCPYIIKDFNKDYSGPEGQTCIISCSKDLRKQMGLNEDEFTDLCIMMGCDMNKNIKGVGLKGCIKAINKHRRISNLPPQSYDITCLNYEECLSIFSSGKKEFYEICENYEDSILIDFDGVNNELEEFCVEYGLNNFADIMRGFYKAFKNDEHLNYNDEPRLDHVLKMGIFNKQDVNIIIGSNIKNIDLSGLSIPTHLDIHSQNGYFLTNNQQPQSHNYNTQTYPNYYP